MKRHPKELNVRSKTKFGDIEVTGHAASLAADLRDDARKAAEPVRPSTSTSPRRCSFCNSWREIRSGRCTHCRQPFVAKPLVGLKAVG